MKQQTEEWFKARIGKITGSRISAILEISPFQKPDDVIRDMVREYHGAEKEFTGNAATRWGNDHEEEAVKLYAFINNLEMEGRMKLTSVGFVQHHEYDWIGVSPDRLVGDDGLLEIKAPYSQKIPASPDKHYEAQCQLQMWVTGRKWCDLFYFTPDRNRTFRINYDPDFIALNFQHIEAFYQKYLSELDNKAHLEPLVETRNDTGFLNAAAAYRAAKSQLEQAQALEKQARENLIELAGDKSCKGGGVSVTRFTRQGNVNYKQIPELESVDLEAYRGKPSVQYRLTLDPDGKPIRDVA